MHFAARRSCVTCTELPLQHGASALHADNHGRFPLHIAVRHSSDDIVQLLVKHSPDSIDATTNDIDGCSTPLHTVAECGNVACIDVLLKAGANINAVNSNLQSALHIAVCNSHKSVVAQLLERGAEPELANNNKWLPIHYACFKGEAEVTCLLLQRRPHTACAKTSIENGNWSPIHFATASGSIVCIALILVHSPMEIHALSGKGLTVAHVAACSGHANILSMLLDKGASGETHDDND